MTAELLKRIFWISVIYVILPILLSRLVKMIRKLSERNVLYVQVGKDQFSLWFVNNNNNKTYTIKSEKKFSSERLAIADFHTAQACLSKGAKAVLPPLSVKKYWRFFKPFSVVIKQEYPCTDLSPVEERVLLEVSYMATKCKKVYTWQGKNLTREDILNKVYNLPVIPD